MKKARKNREKKEEKHIFTEGIDYSETGETSIWGTGDRGTLEIIGNTDISGRWLNLAAGDGRYNLDLLERGYFMKIVYPTIHIKIFMYASRLQSLSSKGRQYPLTSPPPRKKYQAFSFPIDHSFSVEGGSFHLDLPPL